MKTKMPASARRYAIRFTVAMVAYCVLLVVGLVWLNSLADGSPWTYAAVALPVPALIGIVWVVYRYVVEADEMLSRDTVRSLAIGFAGGSLITFTYGLFQIVGAPPINLMFVWPVYAACWAIGQALVRWSGR